MGMLTARMCEGGWCSGRGTGGVAGRLPLTAAQQPGQHWFLLECNLDFHNHNVPEKLEFISEIIPVKSSNVFNPHDPLDLLFKNACRPCTFAGTRGILLDDEWLDYIVTGWPYGGMEQRIPFMCSISCLYTTLIIILTTYSSSSWACQDLASQLAAAAGGRAAGDALSADDNATLRQTLADMEAQLAAAAAEAERLHDENFELSLAAADNKFEVQELTEALEVTHCYVIPL